MNSLRGLVLIGGSAGAIKPLFQLVNSMEPSEVFSILVVLHRPNSNNNRFSNFISKNIRWPVSEPEHGDQIQPGNLYLAPAGYHLLTDKDGVFQLSNLGAWDGFMPSINVLFSTACEIFKHNSLGVLLSGAGSDGIEGLGRIGLKGGQTIIQSPESSEVPILPNNAIANIPGAHIMDPQGIPEYITNFFAEDTFMHFNNNFNSGACDDLFTEAKNFTC